jgi:hypothetical protein
VVKNVWSHPFTPQYTSMELCLIKYRDNHHLGFLMLCFFFSWAYYVLGLLACSNSELTSEILNLTGNW